MNRKKAYSSPDLELMKLILSADVLNISDPMGNVSQGSGGGADAGSDPWGDLPEP